MYKFVKVDKFDIGKNFWEDNYQLRFILPFKKLYDKDKSKDKTKSSKTMWCLWLYCDPAYANKIGKLPEVEKKSAIIAYDKTFDFKDKLINECIIAYPNLCLSEAGRKFKRTLFAIEKFQSLIDDKMDGDLTLDELIPIGNNRWQNKKGTAGQIADLKKKATQLWKEYEPIQRLFEEEQGSMQLYGGGSPTVMENGELMLIKDEDE